MGWHAGTASPYLGSGGHGKLERPLALRRAKGVRASGIAAEIDLAACPREEISGNQSGPEFTNSMGAPIRLR